MHIPDGYLGPSTYGSLWAVMLGVWSYASRRVQREIKASQAPHLAMASAFSFVVMIIAVPLPGGTTAHVTGATLVAILLGPWAAVIAVSVALMIQSLVFGDGGITALAANCFNISFASSLAGYATYRIFVGIAGRFSAKDASSPEESGLPGRTLQIAATGVSSYVGINIAALLTALELGLQPLIYGTGQAGNGYFPYGLGVTLPAVVLPHLTLVGALEGIVAAAVVGFMRKGRMNIKYAGTAAFIIAALVIFQASGAYAHDFLIEQKGQELLLVYGHGAQAMEFEESKIVQLRAIDTEGKELAVQKEHRYKALLLKIAGQPASVMAEIDNGYWSKTIYGWKELPRRKASRVVEAIRSLYFTRTLLSWSGGVQDASGATRLEIVPMADPFVLKPGDQLPVKVLGSGKPLSGIEVIGFDHAKRGTTDKEGIIKVPLTKGINLVTVEYKEKIKDDPDADALSLTATLTFEVK